MDGGRWAVDVGRWTGGGGGGGRHGTVPKANGEERRSEGPPVTDTGYRNYTAPDREGRREGWPEAGVHCALWIGVSRRGEQCRSQHVSRELPMALLSGAGVCRQAVMGHCCSGEAGLQYRRAPEEGGPHASRGGSYGPCSGPVCGGCGLVITCSGFAEVEALLRG